MARRALRPDPYRDWDKINPYVSWALGPGRSYYFAAGQQEAGKEVMPLLLRLKGKAAKRFLEGAFITDKERVEPWRAAFRVLCRREVPGATGKSVVWVSALASDEIIQAMALPQARRAIEGASMGLPLGTRALEALKALPKDVPKPPAKGEPPRSLGAAVAPSTVVMGVIDDGIAFLHERFQKPGSKTRIQHGWLMDSGIMVTEASINALLGSGHDEDHLYRNAQAIDFVSAGHKSIAWQAAHGTHVMDLACGYDPSENRTDRPIAFAQLPPKVTAAEAPWPLAWNIALGISWLVDSAIEIAASQGTAALPLVINISYGLLAAWQDGLDLLGSFIEDMKAMCHDKLGFELRVVLPSGNSYLSRIHGQVAFTASGQKQTLKWRILPDDRTPSFLEVWLPHAFPTASRLTLRIKSPTGVVTTIKEGWTPKYFVHGGVTYAKVTWLPVLTSDRAVFTIQVQPTAHPDPSLPLSQLAPAGTWEVELTYTGGLAATELVHAWIRRDDSVFGYPLRGRQSHLEDEAYVRWDHAGRDQEDDNTTSFVRRESTINSIATDKAPIVIGGYLGKEWVAAKYSAAGAVVPPGPTTPPALELRGPPRSPDAMAPSEDSRVHRGVLAAGSRSGSVVAMGGTSVAGPQIARIIARELGLGGAADHAWVQGQAEPVTVPPLPLPQPREERGGAGRIPTDPIVKVKRFELD